MTYEKTINAILDDICEAWHPLGWKELAGLAGLHYSTVHRIMVRDTKCPLFRTVWKLAKAVGMELRLVSIKQYRKAG